MTQMGFYFDQTRCTGFYTCAVACKDWHDIDAGPVNWMWVHPIEKGKFEKRDDLIQNPRIAKRKILHK